MNRGTNDPALTTIVNKWKALAAPIANRVVGTITANITNPGNRQIETSMQNLVADAILHSTKDSGKRRRHDGFRQPGRRAGRTHLHPDLRRRTARTGHLRRGVERPAVRQLLVTMDLRGSEHQAVLEQQFFAAPAARPSSVLGISQRDHLRLESSAPPVQRCRTCGSTAWPIDPGATYRVATNNFLADGGDGFTVFRQGTNRIGGGDDSTALVSYLGANSPVAPPPIDRINEVP